jgi:hypothetical protein
LFHINQILAFLLLAGPVDENGWASVEPPKKNPLEQKGDGDPSVWPVFSRQFGSDRLLIRFPADPVYRYPNLDQGDSETMEIESEVPGTLHRIRVERSDRDMDDLFKDKIELIQVEEESLLVLSDRTSGKVSDFLYRSDSKWIRERIIASSERTYVLQTFSDSLSDSAHQKFISSLDLEIRGENRVFHREIASEN